MVKIFSFHRVHPERDSLWDPVSPVLFEKILSYLTQNYILINLETILLGNTGIKDTSKIACIVFDDGYKDNIEFALPLLNKYGIKASFYIVTDCIDKQELTWTHELSYIFQHTKKQSVSFEHLSFLPLSLQKAQWPDNEKKFAFALALKKQLKTIPDVDRKIVLDTLKNQCNDVVFPKDIMMSWEDIRQLHKTGHQVGSHTVTHRLLAKIAQEEDIRHELQQSSLRIKQETGIYPLTISYPVGSYDDKVISLAKEAGYRFGLAVEQRFYIPEKDNIMAIPRVELYNESMLKTRLRISGNLERIKKLIGK